MIMIHFHKWTDWAVTDRGRVEWRYRVVGAYLVQERHCLTCGKTQVGNQASYGHAPRMYCNRVSQMGQRVLRNDPVT